MTERADVEGKEEPDLTGVDPRFHEVVRQHGRALWVLVFNANMAREALTRLSDLANKHGSKGGQQAVQLVTAVLMEQGSEYVKAKGWGQEEIDACSRDILLAMQEQRIQLIH